MNYKAIYNDLVASARGAAIRGYTERHHIVPKCLGGSDSANNIIKLSARQHFIAHLLLAKIYGGKLIYAAWLMSLDGLYTSRKYEWLKRIHSEQLSKDRSGPKSPNYRKAPWNKGVKTGRESKEVRDKKSIAMHGNMNAKGNKFKQSPDAVKRMVESRIRNGNLLHSETTKQKLRQIAIAREEKKREAHHASF